MKPIYLIFNSALAVLLSKYRMDMIFREHDRKYKDKFDEIKKQLEILES